MLVLVLVLGSQSLSPTPIPPPSLPHLFFLLLIWLVSAVLAMGVVGMGVCVRNGFKLLLRVTKRSIWLWIGVEIVGVSCVWVHVWVRVYECVCV